MKDMYMINATDARKEWSSVMDRAVRERPQIIRHNLNEMILANLTLLESVLAVYKYTAHKMLEDDGAVTLLLNEIDLVQNGANEFDAKYALAKSILEYAEYFYDDFHRYSLSPNRKGHVPYVLKAFILNNSEKISELVTVSEDVEI